jgi:ATP-dependent protease ClpP protease subunit
MMFWTLSKKRKREGETEETNDQENDKNQHNLYVNNNHIYFNDDITSDTAFTLKKELQKLDSSIRSKSIIEDLENTQPIYLHLTTNGGCIHSALSVVDCIENLKTPVYTVIEGYVASAGTIISIHGQKRYITRNSYILIHQLRCGFWGKLDYLEDEYNNCKKVDKHIIEMYLKKTKVNKKQLLEILKKDIDYNATEAIKLGLVDEVFSK